MTAEELAVGQARLRSKLLQAQQELAILSDEANELSDLLATTAQTLLHQPSTLKLTDDEAAKINGARLQELASKIRSLEQRERELQEKVSRFS